MIDSYGAGHVTRLAVGLNRAGLFLGETGISRPDQTELNYKQSGPIFTVFYTINSIKIIYKGPVLMINGDCLNFQSGLKNKRRLF
jgi:hypothetical protein